MSSIKILSSLLLVIAFVRSATSQSQSQLDGKLEFYVFITLLKLFKLSF